ncbi:glycosyltransferase family 4 protein [Streptomyces sp. YIM S03343]
MLRHSAHLGGMGRAAEFFTPVVESSRQVVSVVSLSADRGGSMRVRAAWPARVSATAAALARCVRVLAVRTPGALYLPVAQWGLPLLRDTVITVIAKAFRCTPVLHLHGSQLPARLRTSAVLRKALGNGHWLVLSDQVADDIRASGCRTASVRVIRNPAPTQSAPPRPPDSAGPLRIGWLGTMHRSKGFDIVCDAVAGLKGNGAPVSFSVAGMRSDVPPQVMACVDEDFGVLEPDEVGSFWSGVDVFVLPARWAEGLPFVLLESLQSGCAVAATWSPGSAELFERGCVERIDGGVASVTAFLTRCLADIDGVRSRQQKAWEEIRPLYDPDTVRDGFSKIWRGSDF